MSSVSAPNFAVVARKIKSIPGSEWSYKSLSNDSSGLFTWKSGSIRIIIGSRLTGNCVLEIKSGRDIVIYDGMEVIPIYDYVSRIFGESRNFRINLEKFLGGLIA